MSIEEQWWASGTSPLNPDGPNNGGDAGDAIGQSLRFRGSASAYLTRTGFTSPATYTVSYWFKLGDLDREQQFVWWWEPSWMGMGYGSPTFPNRIWNNGPSSTISDALYRDSSGWQHIVINTGTDNWYVNGVKLSPGLGNVQPGQTAFTIGGGKDTRYAFDGYVSSFQLVDGQELGPETFGRYNSKGSWVPIDTKKDGDTAWYGPNGFRLTFEDADNVGKDYSGNGNDFTAIGFDTVDQTSPTYDIMADSPTNNFATLVPIVGTNFSTYFGPYSQLATSDANLTMKEESYYSGTISSTGYVSSGVYAAQIKAPTNSYSYFGIVGSDNWQNTARPDSPGYSVLLQLYSGSSQYWYKDTPDSNNAAGTLVNYGAAQVTPDTETICVVDATNQRVRWDINGTVGDWVDYSSIIPTGKVAFYLSIRDNSGDTSIDFGQQGSFAMPADALTMCTANMPTDELPDTITGTFTGNDDANGPFVYTGCIPARIQYGTIDVKYQDRLGQTDVDFLSNGFKVRSTTSNSGTVSYTVTTTHDGGEYDGNKIPFQSPASAVAN